MPGKSHTTDRLLSQIAMDGLELIRRRRRPVRLPPDTATPPPTPGRGGQQTPCFQAVSPPLRQPAMPHGQAGHRDTSGNSVMKNVRNPRTPHLAPCRPFRACLHPCQPNNSWQACSSSRGFPANEQPRKLLFINTLHYFSFTYATLAKCDPCQIERRPVAATDG